MTKLEHSPSGKSGLNAVPRVVEAEELGKENARLTSLPALQNVRDN